uniref:mitogen-activated protein kinase kinase n=1 Tax=Panagrolaimus davidi TaxID=227884 RepID=A0A914Q7P2_9BILA
MERMNIGESGIIRIGSKIYKNVKINHLKIFAELGSGAFGIVTKRILDNNILAVKEIFKMNQEQERKKGFMDLSVIKNANSPFIVKYYGYITDFDSLYICMEPMTMCLETLYKNYVQPQNLKIPEFILGSIAVAVVKALKYLEDEHSFKVISMLNLGESGGIFCIFGKFTIRPGLIHRDIKPSNILINKSGAIKLCDFGIAAKLNDKIAMASSIGSFLYLSPERHARKKYDCKSDIWSLGISLFELATFKYPYSFENEFELLLLIIDQDPPKLPNTFSSEFQLFVNQCLIKDPNLRPTYKNLV